MTRFRSESLVFVFGTLIIVASLLAVPAIVPDATEVAAQLLLVIVLAGALYAGRSGGFIAALLAIAVYVAMRLPLLESQGFTPALLRLLAIRSGSYAIVGVVGGDLWGRVKYLFARLENNAMLDPESGVYSARFAASAIASGIGHWQRYQTPFSIVRMTIAPAALPLRTSPRRRLLRRAAGHISGDIRVVDHVAAEATGIFLVILPRTGSAGARTAAVRLTDGVRAIVGGDATAVHTRVYSADTDLADISRIARILNPADPADRTASADPVPADLVDERAQAPVA